MSLCRRGLHHFVGSFSTRKPTAGLVRNLRFIHPAAFTCSAVATKTRARKGSVPVPPISLAVDAALHKSLPGTARLRPILNGGLQSSTLLIGIDPGTTGAVAAVLLDHGWAGQSVAEQLHAATLSVHDMPTTELQVSKRIRRETCPVGFTQLVRQLQAGNQSSIHAVMEVPAPNALNGKQSWYGCGYAYGTCKGILLALGVQVHTVSGRLWKSHLLLNGQGKEGSRLLALDMFPQAAKLISRKKDHGRAEALLIAAWALGARNATVPDEEMAPVIGEMAPAIAETAPVVEELAPAETLAAEPLP